MQLLFLKFVWLLFLIYHWYWRPSPLATTVTVAVAPMATEVLLGCVVMASDEAVSVTVFDFTELPNMSFTTQ